MKVSKKEVKEYVRLWIVFEIIVALCIIQRLGSSGLARKFCEHFPMEQCREIDWEYYGLDDLD